jgi:hypothetical protein
MTTDKIIIIAGIIVVAEMLLAFLFAVTAQVLYKKIGFDFKSIIKGMLERLFLMTAFINNYPGALTFFSALKLATRLKHHEKEGGDNKYNDYYLVGNLVSVAVAIGYTWVCQHLQLQ